MATAPNLDFLEWLRTGYYRGISLGSSRAECAEKLGLPDGWQNYPQTMREALESLKARGISQADSIQMLQLRRGWETRQLSVSDVIQSEYASLVWDGMEFFFSDNRVSAIVVDLGGVNDLKLSRDINSIQNTAIMNQISFTSRTGYARWSDFDAQILTFSNSINFVFIRPTESNIEFSLDRIEQKESHLPRIFYFDNEDQSRNMTKEIP